MSNLQILIRGALYFVLILASPVTMAQAPNSNQKCISCNDAADFCIAMCNAAGNQQTSSICTTIKQTYCASNVYHICSVGDVMATANMYSCLLGAKRANAENEYNELSKDGLLDGYDLLLDPM